MLLRLFGIIMCIYGFYLLSTSHPTFDIITGGLIIGGAALACTLTNKKR